MTEYSYKTCPICGIHYAVDKTVMDYKARNKKGKDSGWYCPNGHSLIFREYDADKIQRDLDRARQTLAEKEDAIAQRDREIAAQKSQVTKLKKRSSAGTCPCCQRTFQNMSTHIRKQHPEFGKPPALKVVS